MSENLEQGEGPARRVGVIDRLCEGLTQVCLAIAGASLLCIVAINGAKMSDKAELKKAKGSWKAGQSVTYSVQRAGAEQQIPLTLAKTPDAVYTAMLGAHMLENHAVMATASAEGKAASSDKK